MNPFDARIIWFVNGFVQRSWTFDAVMAFVQKSDLFKGGVVLAVLWWGWFRRSADKRRDREILLATIAGALASVAVARALAFALPFRTRPIFVPSLHLQTAYTMNPAGLLSWSSFPSDHAALFIGIATGFFFISRRIGAVALAYSLVVICFPRVYLGLHYPTDILVGAALGAALTSFACRPAVRERIANPALRFLERHPGMFYGIFFLATYQVAVLFNDVRQSGIFAYHLLRAVIGLP
ncbi:MAG TPA: phosphatase PAP2 family protein [Gemmatimonadaceae bacterium]|nr:phosphatase PAP2 family protein [Gemmatimonadaceae bacterium]